MSGHQFIVPPRSWDSIYQLTNSLRLSLELSDIAYFPIMNVCERILDQQLGLFSFGVRSVEEMGEIEGLTCPLGTRIDLREDVYVKACSGDARARFTVAHEVGHFFMHTNVPLARAMSGQSVKAYRCSEAQANQFAAELLMPRIFFSNADTVEAVVGRHGVSYEAAERRLGFLARRGLI